MRRRRRGAGHDFHRAVAVQIDQDRLGARRDQGGPCDEDPGRERVAVAVHHLGAVRVKGVDRPVQCLEHDLRTGHAVDIPDAGTGCRRGRGRCERGRDRVAVQEVGAVGLEYINRPGIVEALHRDDQLERPVPVQIGRDGGQISDERVAQRLGPSRPRMVE